MCVGVSVCGRGFYDCCTKPMILSFVDAFLVVNTSLSLYM